MNADKRRAVETLLRDEEWSKWSDREVAKRAGVSHLFVANLRKQVATVATSDAAPEPERRKGADGKSYPATKPKPESAVTSDDVKGARARAFAPVRGCHLGPKDGKIQRVSARSKETDCA